MILTLLARTKNAIRMVRENGTSAWLVYGKATAWPDELNPPSPVNTDTSLISPFAAARATPQFVIEDNINGTIVFTEIVNNVAVSRAFTPLADEEEALDEGARMVLWKASVSGNSLITAGGSSFRQVGLFTDLTPTVGNESALFLPSTSVEDFGQMEAIDNRVAQPLIAVSTYATYLLVEF